MLLGPVAPAVLARGTTPGTPAGLRPRSFVTGRRALSCRLPRYALVDTWSRPLPRGPGGRHGDTDLSWLRRHRQPRRSDLLHLRHEPAPARPGGGGDHAAHGHAG